MAAVNVRYIVHDVNAAIAFARVVISSIDNHYIVRDTGKQIPGKVSDFGFGNRDDNHIAAPSRVRDRDRLRAAFLGQPSECIGSS